MSDSDQLTELILEVFPALIKCVHKTVSDSVNGEFSIPQLRILKHISAGVDTAAELAEIQDVSIPAVSKMLDILHERGLVARNYRDGNRKQIFLALTPVGAEMFGRARFAARMEIGKRLTGMSEGECANLTRALNDLKKICL